MAAVLVSAKRRERSATSASASASAMVEMLLGSGARAESGLDCEVWWPLSAAAHLGGRGAAARALLAAGADAGRGGRHAAAPLMRAAAAGDAATTRVLLAGQGSPGLASRCRDLQGMSPLLRASELGHADVVEVLLKHGADVSTEKLRHTASSYSMANY